MGTHLGFDSINMERLIYLSLMENEDKKIHLYFSTKLNEEFNIKAFYGNSKTPEPLPEDYLIVGENIYSDIALMAIFDLISLRRGNILPSEISQMLYTFPELKNPKILEEKLTTLTQLKLIEPINKHGQIIRFNFSEKKLFFVINKSTAHHMVQYVENYKRTLLDPESKAWISSGFIVISQEKMAEVRKRFHSFRNWMLSIDSRSAKSSDMDKTMLFQFDMNLLCLLKDAKVLSGTLSEWADRAP